LSAGFLHSIRDLSASRVRAILADARDFERASTASQRTFSLGLLFLSPSLRTRVGFASAAIRLGGSPVEVTELRSDPGMSAPESFADTLRVLSGMVDIVVVRTPFRQDRQQIERAVASSYVNGGDADEHPTQALVDLYAIERGDRPLAELRLGICGDLDSRSARSLISLLELLPPRELVLISPGRQGEADFAGLDVLYMAGLPRGTGARTLGWAERKAFALTPDRLKTLSPGARVLAPMPVVDEIDPAARADPRVRLFSQSDAGVYVRMAVLGFCLGRS
jgi:aspartate carbamoyltransferase catalytic subunit